MFHTSNKQTKKKTSKNSFDNLIFFIDKYGNYLKLFFFLKIVNIFQMIFIYEKKNFPIDLMNIFRMYCNIWDN